MKDDNGLYYHPDPTDTRSRVYVRKGEAGPEFRLWHAEHPEIWERHDWLPFSVIQAAASLYKERKGSSDPASLYDVNVAAALLKDAERRG